jgi:transposase-like protein
MSGPNQAGRFVLADMRRRWTLEEKRAVVGESQASSASVSAVARRHGLAPALLFRWRRELGVAGARRRGDDDEALELGEPDIVELVTRSGLRLRFEAISLNRVLDILEAR